PDRTRRIPRSKKPRARAERSTRVRDQAASRVPSRLRRGAGGAFEWSVRAAALNLIERSFEVGLLQAAAHQRCHKANAGREHDQINADVESKRPRHIGASERRRY